VGVEIDNEKLNSVVSSLKGKNLSDVYFQNKVYNDRLSPPE